PFDSLLIGDRFTELMSAIEQAHGGTLLIVAIDRLAPSAQARLLRCVEGKETGPGEGSATRLDVRLLVTTEQDLENEILAGRFRKDLFYRLAVVRVSLPGLCDREGDVPLLVTHFWRTLGGVGAPPVDFVRELEQKPWPGNVAELVSAV